ncbi:MAG TPA: hypothetical protein VND87_13290 [Stellaceae bacterium]|nr:hypothetical protein [Stellaceae bacterium]
MPDVHNDPSSSHSSSGSLSGSGSGALSGSGSLSGAGSLAGSGALAGAGALSGSEAISAAIAAVCVDVNVNVDLSASGNLGGDNHSWNGLVDNTHAHLDAGANLFTPVFDPIQTTDTGGHNFALDQVNNLVANNDASHNSVSLSAGAYGDAGVPSSGALVSLNAGGGIGDSATHAEGAATTATSTNSITMSAFSQSIVLGANIQFNSLTLNNVGGDSVSAVGGHAADHIAH